MRYSEPIALRRDIEAIQIPVGTPIRIHAGTEVRVTQALGDTYTILTDTGYMARITHADADALGFEVVDKGQGDENLTTEQVEERVWDALRTVYDPEIPVNIVELGLVYSCIVEPMPEGGHRVTAKITLTAPGCGMGPVLAADAKRIIMSIPTVKDCYIEVVFDPPWDKSMMSEAARLQLGF